MDLVFARLAQTEIADAKRYYESQQRGLGDAFVQEAMICARRVMA